MLGLEAAGVGDIQALHHELAIEDLDARGTESGVHAKGVGRSFFHGGLGDGVDAGVRKDHAADNQDNQKNDKFEELADHGDVIPSWRASGRWDRAAPPSSYGQPATPAHQ